ncbi:unnamed protein product [Danaus chrysippus]|uniref:(African queen) hypothetical protein n=1 Tax=Danaus chrysippus TaxID=151541 RepID=A0A8J2R810_9NEOP|nr:unnamed protein product [Danaus chrysippus]
MRVKSQVEVDNELRQKALRHGLRAELPGWGLRTIAGAKQGRTRHLVITTVILRLPVDVLLSSTILLGAKVIFEPYESPKKYKLEW